MFVDLENQPNKVPGSVWPQKNWTQAVGNDHGNHLKEIMRDGSQGSFPLFPSKPQVTK